MIGGWLSMQILSLYCDGQTVYRFLSEHGDNVLVIDCIRRTMPYWISKDDLTGFVNADEETLYVNKFFYTCRKNSLWTAFLYLLKEKYTDENGLLREEYPSLKC